MITEIQPSLQSSKVHLDSTPKSGVNSENSSLGICTEFSSPPPPIRGNFDRHEESVRSRKTHLRKRFILQTKARDLLPNNNRLRACGRVMSPHFSLVSVAYSQKQGNARYAGLCKCESAWVCPVCAMAMSERRRHELLQAVNAASQKQMLPIHIIFTMRHDKHDELKPLLHTLIKAFDKAMNAGKAAQKMHREFSWSGYVRGLEVTDGTKAYGNGWHPHLHVLMFCSTAVIEELGEEEYAESVRARVWARWSNALEFFGGYAKEDYGVKVKTGSSYTAEYIAKYGREPREKRWSIEREIAKASSKTAKEDGRTPFALLEDALHGDVGAARLFQEFADAIKGRSQLHWSKGLKELLEVEVLNDQDAIAWGADYVSRLLIDSETWREIEKRGMRGDVVAELVEHGGNPFPVMDMIERATGKSGVFPVFSDDEVVF